MSSSEESGEVVTERPVGKCGILYAIATSEKPKTAAELEEEVPVGSTTVSTTLATLWRDGYLARRTRESGGLGGTPYEYAILDRSGRVRVATAGGDESEDVEETEETDNSLPMGESLRTLRESCELTRAEIGERLNVAPAHLSEVEEGESEANDPLIQSLLSLYAEEWTREVEDGE